MLPVTPINIFLPESINKNDDQKTIVAKIIFSYLKINIKVYQNLASLFN